VTGREVTLRPGASEVLLRYDKPGRGHFLLVKADAPDQWTQTAELASPWWGRPGILEFDTRAGAPRPAGWYRTTAPPGLRALSFAARGKVAVWVDGRPARVAVTGPGGHGSKTYRVQLAQPAVEPAQVALRVEQEPGSYAGAAFEEPLLFECGPGRLEAGDWARVPGLAFYSGGAWYRRELTLNAQQAQGRVWLDLGRVSSSAEVRVNGKPAGIRLAPPYRVELTGLVKPGSNRIEVLVYSALANHYRTIPTRYRGAGESGLLGPVHLEMGERSGKRD
jgi:hypothetical protein